MITINNKNEAISALESTYYTEVGEGIEWIGNESFDNGDVPIEGSTHYQIGYLTSLVASRNMEINNLKMDNDHLKEDNQKIVELRDIKDRVTTTHQMVSSVYDRYKGDASQKRQKVLDELVHESEQLEMGY